MKHGGVAPKWIGKAPRKPLTPERLYLEDRREALLQMDPSLRLLTGGLATRRFAHHPSVVSVPPQNASHYLAQPVRFLATCAAMPFTLTALNREADAAHSLGAKILRCTHTYLQSTRCNRHQCFRIPMTTWS